MVLVDQGWLAGLTEGYAEAIGAVTRANNRAGGTKHYLRCVRAVFETGVIPKDCPGADAR